MRKKFLLLAIMVITSLSVFSATFILKYGSTNLSSIKVYIYKEGELIASGTTSSDGTVSFTLPEGNYSYKTATNFAGDVTASSTVTLDHKKFTLTVNDNENNPVSSEAIKVYEDGEVVSSKTTNSSGTVEFYLKPSSKYAYKTSFNQAAFSLLNDLDLTLTKNIVSVVAKYINYPVADYFTLYLYGDRETSIGTFSSSSNNGAISFCVPIGKYLLKNKLNIYTELNIVNATQQFVLDYKKVRFISNETDPNVLEQIVVSNGGYSSVTKTTDGKGYADFYLLPGTYMYSHLGMSESFTVTDDMEINLTTQTITFNLKNAVTQTPYVNHPFYVGKDMNNLTSFLTNSSGTCQIKLKVGDYIFSDGVSSFPFTVSTGNQTIIPPLYDITFNITQNLPNAILTWLYLYSVNTGKETMYRSYTDGMKLSLLSGDYKIRCYGDGFSYSQYVPLHVNQNKTVQGWYVFQLNVAGNGNVAIPGQSYYIKQDGDIINYSFMTNIQGSAIAYLPNGTYQLQSIETKEETIFEINSQNKTLNIQLPDEVMLIVKKDGQSVTSGSVIIYNEPKTTIQSAKITNGIAKARLQQGSIYYVQLSASGVSSALSKIIVSGSSISLDFVSLQIKTEGKGIAFPYETEENNVVYYLKQSLIRLAAVPMQGWSCSKWVINSTNIIDDLVEYTLDGATIAIAFFEQNASSINPQLKSPNKNLNIYPNPAETQINFSETLNGDAVIYDTEGRIVKKTYIYGNNINVSDLTSGFYLIAIVTDKGIHQGNFVKK